MNRKENKGGRLSNEQIEEDLKRTAADQDTNYRGSQDTGDEVVREQGTQVQQEDGTGGASPTS